MTITVKVKSKEAITALLEDGYDGVKTTEGIGFSENTEQYMDKTIECDIDYNSPEDTAEEALPTLGIVFLPTSDDISILHYSWIESFNGEPILAEIKAAQAYIFITKNYAIEKSTNSIVHRNTITTCSSCGNPVIKGETICEECLVKENFVVNSYSYKPAFTFHGTQKGRYNNTNPIWYGIELEYGINSKLVVAKLLQQEKLLYLKQDSSISGGTVGAVELVSHPCSFEYLATNSWVEKINTIDAVNKPSSNGCHIHISRTAFKNDKHYAKFKYLIQSNIELLERIGGRKLNNFCAHNAPIGKIHRTKKNNKNGDRRVVCNESNTDTIELRFMASTTNTKQLLRYIEYVDSMIKYTAYHHNTASYDGYLTYITKYNKKYGNILEFCTTHKALLKGEVTFKQPKEVTKKILDCTLNELARAVKLHRDGEISSVSVEGRFEITFNADTGKVRTVAGISNLTGLLVTFIKAK